MHCKFVCFQTINQIKLNLPLQQSLANIINIFYRNLQYFPLDLIMNVHSFFGTVDIVSEIIMIQIFSHIVQTVQHVWTLPQEVFQCLKITKHWISIMKKAWQIVNKKTNLLSFRKLVDIFQHFSSVQLETVSIFVIFSLQ